MELNRMVRERDLMGMSEAWAVADFRRLVIGNGINMLGTAIFFIGMGWTVAQIGGPKEYGLIFTSYFLGHLPLLLYGGMVVDRMPRRTVALVADIAQAILVSIAVIVPVSYTHLTLPPILLV